MSSGDGHYVMIAGLNLFIVSCVRELRRRTHAFSAGALAASHIFRPSSVASSFRCAYFQCSSTPRASVQRCMISLLTLSIQSAHGCPLLNYFAYFEISCSTKIHAAVRTLARCTESIHSITDVEAVWSTKWARRFVCWLRNARHCFWFEERSDVYQLRSMEHRSAERFKSAVDRSFMLVFVLFSAFVTAADFASACTSI